MVTTLFDNYDAENTMGLNEDEYANYCDDNDCDKTDEGFYDWKNRELDFLWEDLEESIKNFDSSNGGHYLITGTLGLWDGKHDILPVATNKLHDAIMKCIGNMDYIVIENDEENGLVYVKGIHHDGTNKFIIERITDECNDDFENWLMKDGDDEFVVGEKGHLLINVELYC